MIPFAGCRDPTTYAIYAIWAPLPVSVVWPSGAQTLRIARYRYPPHLALEFDGAGRETGCVYELESFSRADARRSRLAGGHGPLQRCGMVFAEIKPQIEKLPHEELVKALAYLKHLVRSNNPEYQRDLAQRHAEIESGRGVSLADAKKRLENS